MNNVFLLAVSTLLLPVACGTAATPILTAVPKIPSVIPVPTDIPTSTLIPTSADIPTPTLIPTPTDIPTPTLIPTPTDIPTPTLIPTPTDIPTPTLIPTPTDTPTPTLIPTPTHTPTATPAREIIALADLLGPPLATLTIGEGEQVGSKGSLCWGGLCADTFTIPTAADPLIADTPFTARFRLFVDSDPYHLGLAVYRVGRGVEKVNLRWNRIGVAEAGFDLPLSQESTIELSLEPGQYVFDVLASWSDENDVFVGDSYYGFLIEVR